MKKSVTSSWFNNLKKTCKVVRTKESKTILGGIAELKENIEVDNKRVTCDHPKHANEAPSFEISSELQERYNTSLSIPPRIQIDDFSEQLEFHLFNRWKLDHSQHIFERNIEVWRQFWIGIEKSTIVAQIIDCRFIKGLLNVDIFRAFPEKKHILVLNKCDLRETIIGSEFCPDVYLERLLFEYDFELYHNSTVDPKFSIVDTLISKYQGETISFVGYPNVGKSSLINQIFSMKKVTVSSTPGKTKYLQTLRFDGLCVIDTPGIVFPGLSKEDMILYGLINVNTTCISHEVEDICNKIGYVALIKHFRLRTFKNDSRFTLFANFVECINNELGKSIGEVGKTLVIQFIDGRIKLYPKDDIEKDYSWYGKETVKPYIKKNVYVIMETAEQFGSTVSQDSDFMAIEGLQTQGIALGDIAKLKAAGICTLKGVLMVTKRNMLKIKGMSDQKVEKVKESAAKLLNIDFISASAFASKREMVIKISTGSTDLDNLLGGGIQSMSITEVFGEFRTGKTQLSHTMCISAQISGDCLSGKVAFIDTEGTFRPERLREIATRFKVDPDVALGNVIYARAYNSEHQAELLSALSAKFSDEPGIFKLLIVDSIMSLFRTDFSGRGELGERQQKLNQFLSKLLRAAEEFNIAVFITNQMMSDPGATMTFVADPKKPIGGHVLAHASTTRVYLRKGRNETRVAKIYDSPDVPESEATFAITPGGIDNAAE